MISVFMLARASDPEQDQASEDGGAEARADIVGHDPPAAGKPLEPPDRPGLDDIKKAEESEGHGDRDPGGREEGQGDELPADLVDDDPARIGTTELGRVDGRSRGCGEGKA